MEKVSIIIPAYNAQNYIKRCLESIIAVEYENKEIIVIDDGSSDQTGMICDKYAEKYKEIKVLHKENGGVSSARNLGLDNATGEYIFFVDSDDYVSKDLVENLCAKEDEDFVQGNCRVLQSENLSEIMTYQEIFEDFALYWFESNPTFVWGNCYKREIIEKNQLRFDENVKIGEDGRFNIHYLSVCNKIRRTLASPCIHTEVDTSAVHKLYIDRLEIQKEECKLVEQFSRNQESMFRLRWFYWHIILLHYSKHIKLNGKKSDIKKIKQKLKNSFHSAYFRETLPYIRKNGTLDEKIESVLMGMYRHRLYQPIMKGISVLYNTKKGLK